MNWNVSRSPFKLQTSQRYSWQTVTSLQYLSTIDHLLLVYCLFQFEHVVGLIIDFLPLLSVFISVLNFCCQEQVVCERLPAHLPANAPHWPVSVCVNHKCLFLPLSGLLPTSHGSLPVSMPRMNVAQVTKSGMSSMPNIHQIARGSRREQSELNLVGYYSEQADCSKLCNNLEAFIIYYKFDVITCLYKPSCRGHM